MKIFLATVETAKGNAIGAMAAGAENVLTSYYYAGYIRRSYRQDWLSCMRHAKLRLIDSGAFTLRTSVQKLVSTAGKQGAAGVDYDRFLSEYITWLREMRGLGLADLWVEVDIAIMTSYDWVNRQRNKIVAAGLGEGLINVWHSDQDWDYWLHLLREACKPGRSRYVALEGNQLNRDPLDYTKFLREAYDRGVRVHTFRMTSQEMLLRYPFYSVDSSSWISPANMGSTTVTTRLGGVRNVRSPEAASADSEVRRTWLGHMPKTKTTYQGRVDAMVASARAWIAAERHITNIWLARGVDWDAAIANPKVTE